MGEALGGFFDKEQHKAVHQVGIVARDFAQVGCIEDVGRLEKKIMFAHRVRVFPVHSLWWWGAGGKPSLAGESSQGIECLVWL